MERCPNRNSVFGLSACPDWLLLSPVLSGLSAPIVGACENSLRTNLGLWRDLLYPPPFSHLFFFTLSSPFTHPPPNRVCSPVQAIADSPPSSCAQFQSLIFAPSSPISSSRFRCPEQSSSWGEKALVDSQEAQYSRRDFAPPLPSRTERQKKRKNKNKPIVAMFATKALRQAAQHAERTPSIRFIGKRTLPGMRPPFPPPLPRLRATFALIVISRPLSLFFPVLTLFSLISRRRPFSSAPPRLSRSVPPFFFQPAILPRHFQLLPGPRPTVWPPAQEHQEWQHWRRRLHCRRPRLSQPSQGRVLRPERAARSFPARSPLGCRN